MTYGGATILPFALSDRWIVTIESERQLVNVQQRIRWCVVARRKGHDEERLWFANHGDAVASAKFYRDGLDYAAKFEVANAVYERLSETDRARLAAYLEKSKDND